MEDDVLCTTVDVLTALSFPKDAHFSSEELPENLQNILFVLDHCLEKQHLAHKEGDEWALPFHFMLW